LTLGLLDVLEYFHPFKEVLVRFNVDEDSGTPSMLGEYHGPTGLAHALNKRSHIGAKLRKRAYIIGETNAGHNALYGRVYRLS
jgi:hypothetical protein